MLTWVMFPDGGRMVGDFSGALRPGTIVIVDAVEYVIEDLGQIATDQTPKSRRHGKARQFVPIVYLRTRPSSEGAREDAAAIDARATGARRVSGRARAGRGG